jgi:hypothetical protein
MNRTATGLILLGLLIATLGTLQFLFASWLTAPRGEVRINGSLMLTSWVTGAFVAGAGLVAAAIRGQRRQPLEVSESEGLSNMRLVCVS